MKDIVAPIIPSELITDCDFVELANREERIEGLLFSDLRFENSELYDLHVSESAFLHCSFSGSRLINGNYIDVSFSGCDFSNCDLSKTAFRRVSFIQCKLMGTDLINCFIKDVRFTDCQMEYVNFAETKLLQSGFFTCRMAQSRFNACRLEALFCDAELTLAAFNYTSLSGIDLTNCAIDGLQVTLPDLRGLRVSAIQAVELAKLLGLTIID